jgi:hypothetical protein
LLRGDRAAAARLATGLLQPLNNNYVERPWGGLAIHELKGGADSDERAGRRIGEVFEISADDSDEEARRYPSRIPLPDGSVVSLPALLDVHAETLLGSEFVARHGRRWPLLPKTLDIAELLSVQAHPPGNTEVYVIVSAEAGATIRLGFNVDVEPAHLEALVSRGRRDQLRLLDRCASSMDAEELQRLLRPWLADRRGDLAVLEPRLRASLGERSEEAMALIGALHAAYWEVLDLMNEIPVSAGQVIYNANPPRIAAARGAPRSAEVHALGNTEGREIVAFEIRRPGPTFRAWDNVRFPVRPVDAAAAIAALNLERTEPAEFIVERVPVRPGVARSVDADYRLEHLVPTALSSIDVPAAPPHSLHAVHGAVTVYATDGTIAGRLERGDSAIVPIGVGAYRVVADREPASVLKAEIPW